MRTQWYAYWGSLLDGFFSWEAAWPMLGGFGGNYPGDIPPDIPVIAGANHNGKGYMIGICSS